MKFTVYSKDGSVIRCSGYPKYVGTYLGVPYLEFSSIESPTPINWERGDFIIYHRTGFTYYLHSIPQPKKQADSGHYGAAFVYSNVKFYSAVKDLDVAPFRDVVSEDNEIHFSTRPDVSTFENVYGIATRIQENLNDLFPNKWEIRVYDTNDTDLLALFEEAKEFSLSNGSCLGALSLIYDTWKNVGWTHSVIAGKEVITIGSTSIRTAENTTDAYAYGKGNGLKSIKKAAANEDEFATRLYVYGSDRNIQTRYYNGLDIHNKDSVNIVNLMLPLDKWGRTDGKPDARKAYLQASDEIVAKYGLIPRIVYFDGSNNEEIYPSITGLTYAQVRKAMQDAGKGTEYLPKDYDSRIDLITDPGSANDIDGSKEATEQNRTFTLVLDSQIGFNLEEQGALTAEGYATISMKSGACAGRNFLVKKQQVTIDNRPILTLERAWDESIGMGYPNATYPLSRGDQFVLLDIPMPDFYITLAQYRLLDKAEKMLEDYTRVSAFYEPDVDSIVANRNIRNIREGMYMQVYDNDIVDTEDHTDYVLIDTLTIDEKGELPSFKISLREQKRSARTFGTLEEMIEDAKRDTDVKIARERKYSERRFRDAKETISMLEQAMLEGFTESISPITVKTMSLLVGDESLQFRFVNNKTNPSNAEPTVRYDKSSKNVVSSGDVIQHMTLGIDSMAPTHSVSEYKFWTVKAASDLTLDDSGKAYYLYIKANASDTNDAEYVVSTSAIGMTSVSGYYHFLTAVINSELDGDRSLSFLNGFTEVLPSQVTTEKLRDSSGNLVIDLANATITAQNGAKIIGDVTFGSGSTGLGNIPEWNENVLKNLLQVEEEYVGQYNQYFYYVENFPFTVNAGETYTINIESLEIASGTPANNSFVVVLYAIGGSSAISSQASFTVGQGGHATLTIKSGISNSSARLMIGKNGGSQAVARIKRMSLVKGTAPLTTWKENKDYLYNAFKSGNTKVSGGLVMTQAVMVEDGNGTIKGVLNGSSVAENATYGKLILGAGINGTSENDIKNAKVKIYDSGRIEVDNKATAGSLSIAEDGIRLTGTGVSATLGNCVGAAIQAVGVGGNNVCPREDFNVALHATSSKSGAAIFCDQGQFWGLRPRSVWAGQSLDLDFTNHTIFARGGTISLPSNNDTYLQIGQVYKIIHVETTSLTIDTFGNVYELKGSSGAVQVDSITSTKAEVIDLYYGGENWYFKRSNS